MIDPCHSHSYVFSEPDSPATELPVQLALPWSRVSDRLGLPPVILHSTITLSNWRLINKHGPLALDNLTTLYSFDTRYRQMHCDTVLWPGLLSLYIT